MELWNGALSTINYFSMSTLRGSVTAGEYILFIDATLAWDQAPHWGKRRKKSARFFRRYFSFLTPFIAFFHPCGAWSRANASYAVSKTSYQSLQSTKLNFEKLSGAQGLQSHSWNPFKSVCPFLLPFVFVVSFIPSSNSFWVVIVMFHSIFWQFPLHKFCEIW